MWIYLNALELYIKSDGHMCALKYFIPGFALMQKISIFLHKFDWLGCKKTFMISLVIMFAMCPIWFQDPILKISTENRTLHLFAMVCTDIFIVFLSRRRLYLWPACRQPKNLAYMCNLFNTIRFGICFLEKMCGFLVFLFFFCWEETTLCSCVIWLTSFF